jgi:hypothetical protein
MITKQEVSLDPLSRARSLTNVKLDWLQRLDVLRELWVLGLHDYITAQIGDIGSDVLDSYWKWCSKKTGILDRGYVMGLVTDEFGFGDRGSDTQFVQPPIPHSPYFYLEGGTEGHISVVYHSILGLTDSLDQWRMPRSEITYDYLNSKDSKGKVCLDMLGTLQIECAEYKPLVIMFRLGGVDFRLIPYETKKESMLASDAMKILNPGVRQTAIAIKNYIEQRGGVLFVTRKLTYYLMMEYRVAYPIPELKSLIWQTKWLQVRMFIMAISNRNDEIFRVQFFRGGVGEVVLHIPGALGEDHKTLLPEMSDEFCREYAERIRAFSAGLSGIYYARWCQVVTVLTVRGM